MESRVNYTAVGVFVILFTAALIAFAFWLGKYNQDERDFRRYRLYITESVSGLAPQAAVKFHGVDVGTVERIRINPDNSEEVELTLKIRKETPIKTDSSAVLKFYGITGLAFIEIIGGSKNAPVLTADPNTTMAVIPSSPSLIKRLDESLSNVASKLSTTLDRADRLFDDRNIENVAKTLANLRTLTAKIDGYQEDIRLLLEKTAALETNATDSLATMKNAAGSIKTTSDNANALLQTKMAPILASLEETSRQSHILIQKAQTSLDRGDYDLRSIASPTTVELNAMLEQTRSLVIELENTLNSVRDNPSDLLFKSSAPKPGPGEDR